MADPAVSISDPAVSISMALSMDLQRDYLVNYESAISALTSRDC